MRQDVLQVKDVEIIASNFYQNAIAIRPERPEAYYLLSSFLHEQGLYNDAYMIACLGERIDDIDDIDVDYPGKYGILFQKIHICLVVWSL